MDWRLCPSYNTLGRVITYHVREEGLGKGRVSVSKTNRIFSTERERFLRHIY